MLLFCLEIENINQDAPFETDSQIPTLTSSFDGSN